MKKKKRLLLGIIALLVCLFTYIKTEFFAPDVQVSEDAPFSILFIDVGQADAALVQCDGEYMLIDGGNAEDSSLIHSVLKERGIEELEIMVGTHPHEDHIGGLSAAFSYASAKLTLCSADERDMKEFKSFKKYADSRGGGIVIPEKGDVYSLGSAKVEILGVNTIEEMNGASIVLRIDYKNTSFVFTGDAEAETEKIIIESGANVKADLLKVGHHGSAKATSYQWLYYVDPDYAVISCETGNSYGHPHDEALSRLRDADVTLFRTDLMGDILCTSDGETLSFKSERECSDPYIELKKGY